MTNPNNPRLNLFLLAGMPFVLMAMLESVASNMTSPTAFPWFIKVIWGILPIGDLFPVQK
jgi:hypothetical protein